MSIEQKPFTEMSAVEWLEEIEDLISISGIPQTFVIASLGRTVDEGITFMPKTWYDSFIQTHNETLTRLKMYEDVAE
jgi:hypothetical protein